MEVKIRNYKWTYPYLLILLIGAIVFIPFLGRVHLFDWDEINFAESAREMIVSGNYGIVQINYIPFWEKPPLFFWMQALSMHLFGVNEFAARFPNAICGIVTLCCLFYVGKKYYSTRFGWYWVLAYIGSFLPLFYFKSGIIDPWFNLFIFLSIFQWSCLIHNEDKRRKHLWWASFFAGMGVLTKGPVALLMVALTIVFFYIIYNRKAYKKTIINFIWFVVITGIISILWFGWEILQNGIGFFNEFIAYQVRLLTTKDAGHGGFLLYHFLVLWIGCFPAIIFLFSGWKKSKSAITSFTLHRTLQILLFVVLIVFTLVKTKIVHYSSLAYFPITYFAAMGLYRLTEQKKLPLISIITWIVVGLFWGIVLIGLPYLMMHKLWLFPYINDVFALGNLQADVAWNYSNMLWGIGYLFIVLVAYVLYKKNKHVKPIILLFLATLIIAQIVIVSFVNKIENYSQNSAIEFWKSLKDKDVYVETLNMRSYAPYFYAQIKPHNHTDYQNIDWLLHGNIDKPVYFVCRNNEKENILQQQPQLQFLYEKNGYCFFKREIPIQ